MKRFLLPLFACCAWANGVLAQSASVTPSATTYSTGGGQIAFTVNLAYPANVSSVSFAAKPPGATWLFVSTAGTDIPNVKPRADDNTNPADPNSSFGFAYTEVAPGASSFTFVVSYPAALTGTQTLSFTADYRLNGDRTTIPVTSVTLTQATTQTAPSIISQPVNATANAGATASFSLSVSGSPLASVKWQRSTDGGSTFADLAADATFSGVTTSTLTIASVTSAMSGHRFRAVATNGVTPDATSTAATLTVNFAPTITTQPGNQTIAIGGTATFAVVATGSPAPTYQWRKGTTNLVNGGRIAGATSATLTISTLQSGDDGSYNVVVSNGVLPDAVSNNATLTLLPAGFAATHAIVGAGYVAGSTVTVTNTLTFTGDVSGLGWSVTLPTGWTFASSTGNYDLVPTASQVGTLNWAWFSNLASPTTFTYTVNVPAGTTASFPLVGQATVSLTSGDQVALTANPNPLNIGPVLYHSADTSHDFKIDLSELLRVISYYNTRFTNTDSTKVQTGCYKVQTTTIDGFAPDTTKSAAPAAGQGGLASYHSADTDRNGAISLSELLRVISYYNVRFSNTDGTKVQTGAYKVQAPTVDGYAPDATRAP